jgi:Calx-beta domain.
MKKRFSFLIIGATFLFATFKKNDFTAAAANARIGNAMIVEGNGGQTSVEVTVILSQPTTDPVTINYTTSDGSASAGSDYVAAKGTVSFGAGERVKRISVQVIGERTCEPNETFEIVLSQPSGAMLSNDAATVTIVNDDCSMGAKTYEVRLTFNGYTSLYGDAPDCPIRRDGKVVLSGLVSGMENVNSDDDINYTGALQLDIYIDICGVKRAGGGDQFCGMTVVGSGPVNVQLKVRFDARGGYIKLENKSGSFLKMVFGTCDGAEMAEEETMVPNRTIASVFNGCELPMLTSRTLQVGRYVETGDGVETIVEVLRKLN